ncbi:hypothetical protein D9756_005621 [Leucocoprinus leucothites]|uniref:Uncharacterized protein n=1 Tax=Leucocoprinus leucothites TaxID=201217 RepID=A0A8H5FZ14_9AGAR|nr:hypothetical protein D9756_005621 [Leucoagaricus leucothites]
MLKATLSVHFDAGGTLAGYLNVHASSPSLTSYILLIMKSFTAIATILAYLLATTMASPVPDDEAIPCPTHWPKNAGIGPVCDPNVTPTPTPTATYPSSG